MVYGLNIKNGVENTGGSIEFYKKMLFDFSKNYHDYAEKIQEQIKKDHFDDVKRYIHSIKGVSRTLGIETLAKLTAQLDEAIKSKDKASFEHLYTLFKDEFSKVCEAIFEFEANDLSKRNKEKNDVVENNKKTIDLIHVLDELGEHVKLGNYKAEKIANDLKNHFSDNQLKIIADGLCQAVENLDSKKAEACIARIKKLLEGEKNDAEKT